MKKILVFSIAFLMSGILSLISLLAFETDDVLGIWLNEEKDAKIKIYKKNGKYHGKIVWLKEPNRDGKPKLDKENPDAEKQTRPIMDLVIMTHFVWDGDDVWEDGYIYDPKSGNTYKCKMTISEDKNTLKVRGYIGFSLIGRTSVWTRAE